MYCRPVLLWAHRHSEVSQSLAYRCDPVSRRSPVWRKPRHLLGTGPGASAESAYTVLRSRLSVENESSYVEERAWPEAIGNTLGRRCTSGAPAPRRRPVHRYPRILAFVRCAAPSLARRDRFHQTCRRLAPFATHHLALRSLASPSSQPLCPPPSGPHARRPAPARTPPRQQTG
jgi:hypothetical protein